MSALILIAACVLPARSGFAAEERVDYLKQVKPILRERCFACHGALKQASSLRLDTVASILKGGDSGPAIVPDTPAESILLARISADDPAERMPPKHEGEPLTVGQIALIHRWIASGASAPSDEQPEADPRQHWAFQPIARPKVPQVNSAWVKNPIDAFLARQHRDHGLAPQPEAPRIILLRRLYLDLLGVPPTADEIVAFENDSAPDWYDRAVARLLEDPRHGQRWARHWMDVWRYSDWWGLGDQLRNSQKHMWHWRDWIVESLNHDTPYDEMVRLMLAADELHPDDPGKLRATGYLARNYYLFNRAQWMEETVEHVSKGFLGLTMNCAKCHDHKFDPLEQADFYRMRAFFEPYQVRLDMVPGEADLSRDGIPRVFDGLFEVPTYRYLRGDEKNPDKSTVIAPGVPAILAFQELNIQPVTLPDEAWQPERRPGVLQAHLETARKRLEAAEAELPTVREKLNAAKEAERQVRNRADTLGEVRDEKTIAPPIVEEHFKTLDTARWKPIGGEWIHGPGGLEQKQDGATRKALRLLEKAPRDFDATVRFTTTGGSRWRSVGLSFDVGPDDPASPPVATDSEQNVYVSAVAGGSKVQAAFQRGGQWQYPGGAAMRSMPIELNHSYTLRVQVRGTLINASLDGEPVIAWVTPLARRTGAMQVVAFDALAVFHEVTIRALDPGVRLRNPSVEPSIAEVSPSPEGTRRSVAIAHSELIAAEAGVAYAQAELESTERRAEAQRASWGEGGAVPREKVIAAVRAERRAAAAKARHAADVAEAAVLRAASDKKEAAEKTLKAAREAFEKASAAVDAEVKPDDQYTRLAGALWSPTRFLNSGKDDPTIAFSSKSTGRRTALANWITDPRNPLTARVAVNHIWTRHMGQPLVSTLFDFGRKGARPADPELLDWLATEFMDHGWSMRHLHQVIVTSAAFRMGSSMAGGDVSAAKDPENREFWRRVPIRLESQVVRDTLLSLAGTLDSRMGGPAVPPALQGDSTRRSLYFFHSNNDRSLFLTTFDEALVKDCYRREQSIVPQQALALTNSRLVLDASERIAKRLAAESADDSAFIRKAFRVVLGINASDAEQAASDRALAEWRKLPGGSVDNARANFVWGLINHNDFVTLR